MIPKNLCGKLLFSNALKHLECCRWSYTFLSKWGTLSFAIPGFKLVALTTECNQGNLCDHGFGVNREAHPRFSECQ